MLLLKWTLEAKANQIEYSVVFKLHLLSLCLSEVASVSLPPAQQALWPSVMSSICWLRSKYSLCTCTHTRLCQGFNLSRPSGNDAFKCKLGVSVAYKGLKQRPDRKQFVLQNKRSGGVRVHSFNCEFINLIFLGLRFLLFWGSDMVKQKQMEAKGQCLTQGQWELCFQVQLDSFTCTVLSLSCFHFVWPSE